MSLVSSFERCARALRITRAPLEVDLSDSSPTETPTTAITAYRTPVSGVYRLRRSTTFPLRASSTPAPSDLQFAQPVRLCSEEPSRRKRAQAAMRQVSPTDAAWLALESRDTPMHVGGLFEFPLPPNAPSDYLKREFGRMRANRRHPPPWDLK